MKRRQFEEILDDCISAYLSGSRSVEESLSLYPSIARELEPLLRAAADTAEVLQDLSPPPHVQERIRLNILRAANERAAARALTRQIDGFSPGPPRRWGLVLGIPAAAAGLAAIIAAGFVVADPWSDDDTGSDGSAVSVVERPAFSSTLVDARRQLEVLRLKSRTGQQITVADIDALVGTTRRLAESGEPSDIAVSQQAELEDILVSQVALLGNLSTGEDEEGDEIEDAIAYTVSVAAVFGVAVEPSGPATGASTSTASPSPTQDPSSTLAPTAGPSPTPGTSATPSAGVPN